MNHLDDLSTPKQGPKLNFQALLLLLKQNKRMFVTIFLFVWLLTSVYSLVGYKPSYVASGMVMIKDTALTAKYVTEDSYEMTAAQSTSSVMNTMALLKTSLFMEDLWKYFQAKHPEVLAKLKIKNFDDWQKFYGNGSKLIKSSNLPGTDLISMDFKWSDAVIAKEGLDVVLQTFKDASLDVNRSEQHERRRYLSQQIDEIQQKLTLVRNEMSDFKAHHGIVNTTEETVSLAKAKLDIKTDLAMTNAEAQGKASQVSSYRKLLGLNAHDALRATGLGRNETLAKLQTELYTAQSERASLLTRYTEQSVKVQEVDNHINELQASIQHEVNRSVGQGKVDNSHAISDETRGKTVGDMVSASTEAQQLNTKNRSLQGYLQTLEARAQALPKMEAVLANYQLEETALNDSLKTLKEKELDAQLKESQSLSNVFVVDAPRVPLDASFPRLPHLLVFDFILGLGVSLAAVFLKSKKQNIPFLNGNNGSMSDLQQLVASQLKNGAKTNGNSHRPAVHPHHG